MFTVYNASAMFLSSSGLSAEEKEDEEVSSKATSKSASDVEEISVDEPRPFDSRFDNQHKDEPSPESSLDEDELPTAEPANGQLLTATEPANGQLSSVAETETNTSLTAAEEVNNEVCNRWIKISLQ